MDGARYEELEHTADWAIRVRGATMAELCQVAASAMLAACGARGADSPLVERSLRLEAPDRETLLVQWLEEVLFSLEGRFRMPVRIEVEADPAHSLSARWIEVPLAGIEKPIKAVTFHELAIREASAGLEATIVFDV